MALELKLNQKLSQSLVMTPQLQQAIKLLQLGRHEYLEVLEKELLENPVLEDARDDGDSDDARQSDDDSSQNERLQSANGETKPEPEQAPQELTSIDQGNLKDNTEWLDYLETYGDSFTGSAAKKSESEEDRPSIEATLTRQEGLAEHVLWQLRTTDLNEHQLEMAMQIVGNLDRNGYLACSVEEVAEGCRADVEQIEEVLSVVQELDPPGIAARDLRECLSVQLVQQGYKDSLAWRIVDEHLGSLELRKYDVIAKAEGVSVEEVYEAVKFIQKLEPRPGRPFVDEAPVYITPDIYVRKVDNDYVISLNESGMPKLRLSSRYRELLVSGQSPEGDDKEYLQDRIRSAAWLIKSIHQRQQTIFRVTESIMKHQNEFLEQGVSALKPLILKEIAEDVGMHESTISRVTTNKYVHTPQGVFELKYFFSSGLRSGAGEVSSESVKDRIKQLIAEEDTKKPLSDQAIVNTLTAEGVDIARRTVAKYREMLGILSSSRRKKMF